MVAAANHGQLAGLTGPPIQVSTSHLVLGGQPTDWPLLGEAIAEARQGDPSGFLPFVDLEFADPGYTASPAAGRADYPAQPSDLLALAALSKQFPTWAGCQNGQTWRPSAPDGQYQPPTRPGQAM